jgi:hypothetical protein
MVNQVHMKGYLVHLIWTIDFRSNGHGIIFLFTNRTTTRDGGAMHELLGTAGSSPEKLQIGLRCMEFDGKRENGKPLSPPVAADEMSTT